MKPFLLERFFAKYEFSAPYLMCSSDCESLSLEQLLALEPESKEKFLNLWLGYTESSGRKDLRIEIAKLYRDITPDEVLVFAGAEEGIFVFMHSFLSAGDEVIVHTPYYQSLGEIASSIGCKVIEWEGDSQDRWALSVEKLQTLITAKTKLLIINSPHNPTGYLMPERDFREIVSLSEKHGFLIFSDEVYRYLELNPATRLPSLCDIDERGVSLGVMSKSFGLAGLRIGWIATKNVELLEHLSSFKDYTTICNSAPSEFLAALALRHKDKLINRNLEIIRTNLELLNKFFSGHSSLFNWQQPTAGPIAFPRLLGGKVEEFCSRLIETQGVLLLPGHLYGKPYNHFRVGYGRKNLPQALEKLESFVKELYD